MARSATALSPARRSPAALVACGASLLASGCSAPAEEVLHGSLAGDPGPRPAAFLALPAELTAAPATEEDAVELGFPRLLSETGVFSDVAAFEPAPGLLPYEVGAPLWSDGALKRRFVAVPELGAVEFSPSEAWGFPEGTVFVKHFEMALDERAPEQVRRLETRLWVAAAGGRYYGVTYKWNDEQTDAELLLARSAETLAITGEDGAAREQEYVYPGPSECLACHNESAGYVLGPNTRQLNRELTYAPGALPINQLVAWSGWGLLDTVVDNTLAYFSPRVVSIDDESASLDDRIKSYWDGNCSMCHAGESGSVPGWDARYLTPFEDEGLEARPRSNGTAATHLIAPGEPESSYIYLRGNTAESGLRMPPLGRNRVDTVYVEALERWIASLPTPE